MKINIEIDVTPQEARAFLGLPDVAPLQEEVMEQMKAKMMEGLGQFDPATFDPQKVMQSYVELYPQWMETLTKFTGK